MMKDRRRTVKRYDYLKLQHKCVRCGKRDERTEAGKMHCAVCSKEQNKKAAEQYAKAENKEKKRVYNSERYSWLKSHGYCVMCGKERADENRTHCSACRKYKSEQVKKRYAKKKERERTYESEKETA